MDLSDKQGQAAAVQARLRPVANGRPALRHRRLARTIGLGAAAAAGGIYWLADAYGVRTADLVPLLGMSLGLVALLVAPAVLAGLLLGLLRRRR